MEGQEMVRAESHALAHAAEPPEFTPEQRQMIRDSFASGASDGEFAVLMEIARARRLNPLLRQIHFVSRWDSQKRREVWAPQVSIDGLRAIAQRTGLYDGQDEPEFGPMREGHPEWAKVKVYRKDWRRPAVGIAFWTEYVQTYRDKQTGKQVSSPMWARMPRVMLSKCAESLALRKAFPEDMSGLYTSEEMGQATPVEVESEPETKRESAPPPAPPLKVLDAPRPPRERAPETEPQAEDRRELPAALVEFNAAVEKVELPGEAVAVWIKHRPTIAALEPADREAAWKALCKRTEDVGRMKNAKVWLKKAIAEEDNRRAIHPDAVTVDGSAPAAPDLAEAPLAKPTKPALTSDDMTEVLGGIAATRDLATLKALYAALEADELTRASEVQARRIRAALAAREGDLKGPGPRGGAKPARVTAPANANGGAVESEASAGAKALTKWRAHLAAKPRVGVDRGAGAVAGSWWKHRGDLSDAGIYDDARQSVIDELRARGIGEPEPWLQEIGELNGYVRPAVAA